MNPTQTVNLKDPEQLYLDWEGAHWTSQGIDLSRDPADWAGLEEGQRGLLHFALSSLMVAEERISTQFCGLVLAQDDEEEGSYLASQLNPGADRFPLHPRLPERARPSAGIRRRLRPDRLGRAASHRLRDLVPA